MAKKVDKKSAPVTATSKAKVVVSESKPKGFHLPQPHIAGRYFIIFSGVVAVILVVGVIFAAQDTNKKAVERDAGRACAVLTSAVAKQLIGESKKVAAKSTSTTSDANVTSTCMYEQTGPASLDQQLSLTVRVPRSDDGIKANKAYFENDKNGTTSKKLPVYEKYGDKNTWNAIDGQLDILKANVWYTLSLGSSDPQNRSLHSTAKFAEQIKDQL